MLEWFVKYPLYGCYEVTYFRLNAVQCTAIQFSIPLLPFLCFSVHFMSVMLWFLTKLSLHIWPVNPVCMLHWVGISRRTGHNYPWCSHTVTLRKIAEGYLLQNIMSNSLVEATNIWKWSLQIWHPEEDASHLDSHNTTTTAPHAAFRNTNPPQLKAEHSNIHQKTPAWRNRPPEIRTHRVYVTDVRACCSLPEFRHMWCMHAGCVDVCTAFCLYYKLHLSLSLQPTLQMIKLLSMSASVCYLWVFMIYGANSVNASTWWLLPWYVNRNWVHK